MEYTKGEWKIEEDYTIVSDIFRYEGMLYKIAEVTSHTKEETLANAQLIAAAPALYEELKKIIKEGIVYPGEGFEDAFKAIAKAEGK